MRGPAAKGKRAGRVLPLGARFPGSVDADGLQFAQRRAIGFRHPVAHLAYVGRKFELDRCGAGKACVSDRRHVRAEWRVASTRRQIAMIGAVAIGDVNLGDPAPEPAQRLGRNAHEPEMRDVDGGLDVLKIHCVEKALHVLQRPDERIVEGEELDRELEAALRGMASDLLRRVHDELPLAFRRQEAMLEHVLARDEAEVAGAKLGREIDDVFRPFDMIGADGRVEIAEVHTSELTGISAARTSVAYLPRSAGVMRPGSKPTKRSRLSKPIFFASRLPGAPSYGEPNHAESMRPSFHCG
jgi:hypothetical protein